jgi:hypothetical protein
MIYYYSTVASAPADALTGRPMRIRSQIHGKSTPLTAGIALMLRALLGAGLAPMALAAAPLHDLGSARTQFELGRAGSPDATALAQRILAQLLATDSDNPLYLAYYGSTFTLQGRDSFAPWTKLRLINQGVGILDRALNLLNAGHARADALTGTASLEARLVSIATLVALPDSLFHRLAVARREYRQAVSDPEFANASPDLRGHLFYEGALIARADHDAAGERSALQRVLELRPDSIDQAEVRARLAELQ